MAKNKHRFLADDAKAALRKAVESVEQRSAAEVVITVRARSGNYRHVDCLMGAVCALAGLLYMFYSPHPFALHWIAAITVVLFALGQLASLLLTPVRLFFAGKLVDESVARAARAQFYDLGISKTRDRSGILVYVSLLERRCEVLPDIGVQSSVPADELEKLLQSVEHVVEQQGVTQQAATALAKAIAAGAELLEAHLPRRVDDENELPDLAE
jgi:putative membrane protein